VTFLLDVNVVIALIDPTHVAHQPAHDWFAAEGHISWATCPMTENGVIRIVSNPKYPNTPGSPSIVAKSLFGLCQLTGHIFWPDNISLVASNHIDPSQILTSAQVTDSYLIALASAHGGKLATLDRRLSTKAVPKGKAALKIIGEA
jgi:toxin-antitoxin system PIN domain toxin